MPESIVFNTAARYVEVRYDGIVDHETILRIIREMLGHPDYAKDLGVVWDLRDASLSGMTLRGMEKIWRAQSSLPVGPASRIAVVFSQDGANALLHLWRSAGSMRTAMERRHFRDIDEARRWVRRADGPDQDAPPDG